MVEGKPCPILPSDLAAELNEYARLTRELRCDIDHEREKHRRLEDSVRQLEFEHEKSRANNAVALLENERRLHSLSKELATVLQEIVQYHGTISSLRDQVTTLVRDNGILKGSLRIMAIFVVQRSRVLNVRTKKSHVKRRMHTHPAWQLDRVCIT